MMKAKYIIFVSVLAIFGMTSCYWQSNHTVVGKGDVQSMEVEVASFTGVSVTGECDVDINIGDVQSVELSAQPQILDVMTYTVRNNILHIGFRSDVNVNTDREISARIVMPEVDFVSITGAGNFYLSGENQPSLDIYIQGAGDVEALNMEVDNCTIHIEGVGDCRVNVAENLDVHISGVGNVFYTGQPGLTTDISGVGNVAALSN
jgi:hypothetical protein